MITGFVEVGFGIYVNVILQPHSEEKFSENPGKETAMLNVSSAQLFIEHFDQLKNTIV